MLNVPKPYNSRWGILSHFDCKCVVWVRVYRPAKLPTPARLKRPAGRAAWRSDYGRHYLLSTESLYDADGVCGVFGRFLILYAA